MKRRISKKSEDKLLDGAIKKFVSIKRSKHDSFDSQYDWRYSGVVEIDYNTKYNCDENSCNPYCRCGEITNISLSNFDANTMVYNITYGMGNYILIYCIDRIIRQAKLTEDCFSLSTCNGYYGEEVTGLYLDEHYEKLIAKNLLSLKGISDIERIKYTLTLEYGYLLDALAQTNSANMCNININDITFQDDYCKKIDVSENYYDEKFQLARGILIASGKKFRLIDGYHRMMKAKSLGMKTIQGIVLK